MTPFLEFRLWWRRAPFGRRSATFGAIVIVLGLLAWIAVPSTQNSVLSTGSGSAGGSPSAQGPGASGGVGVGANGNAPGGVASGPSSNSGVAGSTGAAGAPAGGASPGSLGGPTSGGSIPVTATGTVCGKPQPLSIGVVLINVGGLNSTVGLPDTGAQQGAWNAMFDSVNKSGGVACHTLVPDFQTYNEFDTTTARTVCLEFVQRKVFAVQSGFLPTATDDCILQNHIPQIEDTAIARSEVEHFYPYYMSASGEIQTIYKNWAHAVEQMGAFDPAKGFKKLGIFYRDCQPDVNAAMLADLAAVGVPSSAIVRYDFGCPANFVAPSAVQQAILQFKAAGVTTATLDNDSADAQTITKTAQAQGFRPHWVLPDSLGIVATTGSGALSPDPSNFDNALAITAEQYGAENSGIPESATDKACDQIMTSHGQPGIFQSGDKFNGAVCDQMWMLAAALRNAPRLAQDQLVAGLQRAGSVPMAFPVGPNDFTKQGTATGGQFWRAVVFHAACTCWKLVQPQFSPSF